MSGHGRERLERRILPLQNERAAAATLSQQLALGSPLTGRPIDDSRQAHQAFALLASRSAGRSRSKVMSWTKTRPAEPSRIRSSFRSEEQASKAGAAAVSDVVRRCATNNEGGWM